VPNGTYCLVGRADPENRILETDDTNNLVRTRILIDGTVATIRPKAC
jgi:subtilase family serine protease